MRKLNLSKIKFLKAILKNNINILSKKVNSLTISKSSKPIIKYHINSYDIFIIIVSKTLMDLIGTSSGGTNNIIKSIPKENINQKETIAISETKTLFGKIIVITPNINKKTKLIVNTIKKQEKPKKSNEKINSIQKKHINNISKNQKQIEKPLAINNPKLVKSEKNPLKTKKDKTQPQKIIKQPQNKTKIQKSIKQTQNKTKNQNSNNNFKPKYKLQKKKTKHIALFTTFSASLLFGLALAALSFKKIIKGMFVISVSALLNFKNHKKTNKKLVKKI